MREGNIMGLDRLQKQLQFVLEIDKLKQVTRQTILLDRSRQENSAEHSWHIAIMALLFAEYAKEKEIDLLRVLKMLLIHDVVEIDAGDTYCYDDEGNRDKAEREEKAAHRLFQLLPPDQAREFRALWEEFETRHTPDACFAAALDRFQPLLHNYHTEGESWQKNRVGKHQVIARNQPIAEGAPALWDYAARLIQDAVQQGYLSP